MSKEKSNDIKVKSITTNNAIQIGQRNSTHWTDCDIIGGNTVKGLRLSYSPSYNGIVFKIHDEMLMVVPTANIPCFVPKE